MIEELAPEPSPNGVNGHARAIAAAGSTEAESQAACVAESGRDSSGRFAKGNKGGPGNPFARRVADLRKTILDRATPENVARLVDKLFDQAIEGNIAAAKLVLSYTIGAPLTATDPDDVDLAEWAKNRRLPRSIDFAHGFGDHVSLEFALALSRSLVEAQEIQETRRWLDKEATAPHVVQALREAGLTAVLKEAEMRSRRGPKP